MSDALVEAEQSAKDGILEPLPKGRNAAPRPEENPNGPIVTNTPAPFSLDAEFRIMEAELENCQMTREALARREAVLQEQKADIIRETKMQFNTEARESGVGNQNEEGDEGLYMRNVQRRVKAKLERANGNTNDRKEETPQRIDEVTKENGIPISAPERRRLAHLALFKDDPRLS